MKLDSDAKAEQKEVFFKAVRKMKRMRERRRTEMCEAQSEREQNGTREGHR